MSATLARKMPMARVVVLSLTCVFSLAVLAANGNLAQLEMKLESEAKLPGMITPFTSFNLAVSVMTLLTLPVMLAVDLMRRGAFSSLIIVEIIWLGVLVVLWLSTSAYTSHIFSPIQGACHSSTPFQTVVTLCNDIQVSLAFGWISWILVSAYWGTLFTLAISFARRGQPIWKSTVKMVGTEKAPSSEFKAAFV